MSRPRAPAEEAAGSEFSTNRWQGADCDTTPVNPTLYSRSANKQCCSFIPLVKRIVERGGGSLSFSRMNTLAIDHFYLTLPQSRSERPLQVRTNQWRRLCIMCHCGTVSIQAWEKLSLPRLVCVGCRFYWGSDNYWQYGHHPLPYRACTSLPPPPTQYTTCHQTVCPYQRYMMSLSLMLKYSFPSTFWKMWLKVIDLSHKNSQLIY